ncbi:MAG TPA: hypothetical protein PLO23_09935, partial [Alphaproteobacteria bacterium]|nr:hypothetical protein [Alphaproteobacteria bacterium]
IMTVQAGILNVTLKDFENGRLGDLRETGRSALVPLIDPTIMDLLSSPITDASATRLMSTTKINGLAVYSSQFDLIKTYGEPVATTLLNKDNLVNDYRSPDGNSYEAVFRANDLNRPFV